MPPTDNPRPDSQTYQALVEDLASTLDLGAPVDTPARITGAELATRLAKLLWNAPPDAQLLQIAQAGRLRDPAILQAQVQRMLADAKISGLITGFFDEWLGVNQLASMPANPAAFPEFDSALRQAFQRETELFLESQLRANRPPLELWTANYTFVNDRLARLYGIPNITGPEFHRVTLDGTGRAGLLGQGSFLVTTSYLTRHPALDEPSTSPANRARWIRTHYLGVQMRDPLPNPSPMQRGILLSQQLRDLPDPSCEACHSNFFPWGYALENFDPLGRWRTEFNHDPIDASAALPEGTEFDGPSGLRRVLLERQDAFYTTITERLLAYAIEGKPGISQPTPPERMPAVRAILKEAGARGYTWSSLLAAIAGSAPFQAPH